MKLNPETIKKNTKYAQWDAKEKIENVKRYETDPEKERRTKLQECKGCYYLKNAGAFQALTDYHCENCHQVNTHNDSRIPNYCKNCAKTHQVCRRCGSNMNEI